MLTNLKVMFNKDNKSLLFDSLLELGFRLEEIFNLDNSSSGDSTSIDFAYDFYNRLSEIYDTIIK